MTPPRLAETAGPHVFVDSIDSPVLDDLDREHLERSLRMRSGDPLSFSDGNGSWSTGALQANGVVEPSGVVHFVEESPRPLTVAFSLVKGNKPEIVVQKLTEIGVDRIVALAAERSVVRWDDSKADRARARWGRIVREAAMQSHRVRMPEVLGVIRAEEYLRTTPTVAMAHFDGEQIDASHRSIAVGPEGGWSDSELGLDLPRVTLGDTVLRAETAAISAAVLLSAAR